MFFPRTSMGDLQESGVKKKKKAKSQHSPRQLFLCVIPHFQAAGAFLNQQLQSEGRSVRYRGLRTVLLWVFFQIETSRSNRKASQLREDY